MSASSMRVKVNQKIEREPKVYWFMKTGDTFDAVVKGDDEKSTKKELKNLIKKNPAKFECKVIYRIKIRYHDKIMFGRVNVAINNWIVKDSKLKEKPVKGHIGLVWFDDTDLDIFGWKKKYITNILKGLFKHDIKLLSVMPNLYSKFEDF